jgi:hypothetical protein
MSKISDPMDDKFKLPDAQVISSEFFERRLFKSFDYASSRFWNFKSSTSIVNKYNKPSYFSRTVE